MGILAKYTLVCKLQWNFTVSETSDYLGIVCNDHWFWHNLYWLWQSWCFQQQRTRAHFQSVDFNFELAFISCQPYYKDENKRIETGKGSFFNYFLIFFLLLNSDQNKCFKIESLKSELMDYLETDWFFLCQWCSSARIFRKENRNLQFAFFQKLISNFSKDLKGREAVNEVPQIFRSL